MIEHSSDMMNLISGELLINQMFRAQRTRDYTLRVLEEYRSLCGKAPGFEGSSSSRCKRGHSLIGGLPYNVAVVLPWQRHFEKVNMLHLHFAKVNSKLKLVKKKLLCQTLREFERSDGRVVASLFSIGVAESPEKLRKFCLIQWYKFADNNPSAVPTHKPSRLAKKKNRIYMGAKLSSKMSSGIARHLSLCLSCPQAVIVTQEAFNTDVLEGIIEFSEFGLYHQLGFLNTSSLRIGAWRVVICYIWLNSLPGERCHRDIGGIDAF